MSDIMAQSDDEESEEDWDDDDIDLGNSSLNQGILACAEVEGNTYRTRQKLQVMVNTLRHVGLSFRQFVYAWIREPSALKHRRYATRSQRQQAFYKTLAGMPSTITRLYLKPVLTAELDTLIGKPYFGRFDHTAQIDDIDFDAAFQTLQSTAPTWYYILTDLMSNKRASRTSYGARPQTKDIQKCLFMITSSVCHSRAKKRSNYLASVLDAYLIGSGVKRRVVETLSGFGLCHCYKQGNNLMKAIADREKV